MTGVEILSTTALTAWPLWTVIVTFATSAIIAAVVAYLLGDAIYGMAAGFIVFLMCAIVFAVGGVGEYETGEYTYKVTIDDSVSMNEFLDKYEILDQEGKIYTVKERE